MKTILIPLVSVSSQDLEKMIGLRESFNEQVATGRTTHGDC